MATCAPLFRLGACVATRMAAETLHPDDVAASLARHSIGDWGEIDPRDREVNDDSVLAMSRILSAYTDRNGLRFWIITEADRSMTTVLFPQEY